jgi:hypothetical protein
MHADSVHLLMLTLIGLAKLVYAKSSSEKLRGTTGRKLNLLSAKGKAKNPQKSKQPDAEKVLE